MLIERQILKRLNKKILMPEVEFPINPQLILWDWSGTISDDRDSIYEVNVGAFRDYDLSLPDRREMFSGATGTLQSRLAKEGVVIDKFSEIEVFRKYFDAAAAKGIIPQIYLEAAEVIKRISGTGVPMAIVSTHPQDYLEQEAERYGIKECFRSILGSLITKTEALESLCLGFRVPKEKAVFVGDTKFDMDSGRAIGIPVIGVSHGYHSKEQLLETNPLEVVDDLIEVEKLLI